MPINMMLNMKLFRLALQIRKISVLQTLRANFGLLPRKQALKFPIIVFRGSTLRIGKNARVIFDCAPKTGLLWIGAFDFNWIPRGARNFISLDGTIHVSGKVRFSYHTHMIIGKDALLTLGGENYINHDTRLLVHQNVELCFGARVGWNVQICDTAFHYVRIGSDVSRKTKPVKIGRESWVSSFCNIGRGAYLPDYSVLATCSLLNKDYSTVGTNLLIAGIPAKIVKTGVRRVMESVEPELCGRIDSYFDKNPSANTLDITDLGYENR